MIKNARVIFVWGVHPSTTIDDIVNDLADSGINIAPTDIEKKSKAEAHLCSYRISVAVKDLEKALSPDIWPLRVRVREYVHYSNKNRQPNSTQAKNGYRSSVTDFPPMPNVPMPNRQVHNHFTNTVQGRNNLMVPTFNRFEPLRANGTNGLPNSL